MTPARRQSGVYHSGRRDKAQVAGSSRNGLLLADEEEEELVKEERERLIHERQGTVTGVLDRHDDLVRVRMTLFRILTLRVWQVRELFHLERFVSLLSYVPEVSLQYLVFCVGFMCAQAARAYCSAARHSSH